MLLPEIVDRLYRNVLWRWQVERPNPRTVAFFLLSPRGGSIIESHPAIPRMNQQASLGEGFETATRRNGLEKPEVWSEVISFPRKAAILVMFANTGGNGSQIHPLFQWRQHNVICLFQSHHSSKKPQTQRSHPRLAPPECICRDRRLGSSKVNLPKMQSFLGPRDCHQHG